MERTIVRSDGFIEMVLRAHPPGAMEAALEAYAELGYGSVEGAHSFETHWVNPATGAVETRPQTGLSEEMTIGVDTPWILYGIPAGTELWVEDELLATSGPDGFPAVTFDAAVTYEVLVLPPFPWVPILVTVNVTAAP